MRSGKMYVDTYQCPRDVGTIRGRDTETLEVPMHDHSSTLCNCLRFTCPCGAAVYRFPSDVRKPDRVFCSRACFASLGKTSVERTCPHCGRTRRVEQNRLSRSGRNYCSKECLWDWYRNGVAERLYAGVDTSDPNGCWLRTWSLDAHGYSTIGVRCKTVNAHRLAWELANGRKMRPGYEGAHRCDNPPCINPSHIWEATHHENMRDMASKGRGRNQHTGGRR